MKVGDVVINPFVSEYLNNGKINPNHKVMVVHVGTEYATCLKCNGQIAKNYMHDIKTWKVVKHIDLRRLFMTHDERTESILKELQLDFVSYDNLHGDNEHGCRVIESALKKQVPMKPYNCKTSGGQKGNMCPRCQRILVLGYPQYCEFCGQAINWSDEE